MNIIRCEICDNLIQESSICPICNSELTVDIHEDTEWIAVFTTNDEIFARMLSTNLNRSDIPSEVLVQADSSRGITVGNLAVIKVMVPEPYYAEAVNTINQISDGILNGNEND